MVELGNERANSSNLKEPKNCRKSTLTKCNLGSNSSQVYSEVSQLYSEGHTLSGKWSYDCIVGQFGQPAGCNGSSVRLGSGRQIWSSDLQPGMEAPLGGHTLTASPI